MSKHISNTLELLPIGQTHAREAGPGGPDSAKLNPVEDELQQDLFDARRNIRELAEIGMQAVSEAASLASQSQHDKLYMALSSVMKSTLEANKEMLEVHRARQELTAEDNPGDGGDVINQLFVGTTAEFQELLMNAKKKDQDD